MGKTVTQDLQGEYTSEEEAKERIANLKRREAAGADETVNELLKYGPSNQVKQELTTPPRPPQRGMTLQRAPKGPTVCSGTPAVHNT